MLLLSHAVGELSHKGWQRARQGGAVWTFRKKLRMSRGRPLGESHMGSSHGPSVPTPDHLVRCLLGVPPDPDPRVPSSNLVSPEWSHHSIGHFQRGPGLQPPLLGRRPRPRAHFRFTSLNWELTSYKDHGLTHRPEVGQALHYQPLRLSTIHLLCEGFSTFSRPH